MASSSETASSKQQAAFLPEPSELLQKAFPVFGADTQHASQMMACDYSHAPNTDDKLVSFMRSSHDSRCVQVSAVSHF